ncbi:hypothetical protein DPMN_032655 [Dreissena polymorpha]|uniref:Uncharacterized protein n=1 Tax=Dreissena polymorpha TaxID=45954 RepID=A0A9D4M707_DREPO|nr:hypothetical protein DPMN_032655 [Dreissena polymorpha]
MAFFGIYLLSLLFILLHTWKRETGKGAVRRSNDTSIPAKTYLAPANNPVSCLPPKCLISCLPTNSLSSCLSTNSLSSCLSPPAIDSANGLQTNSPAINPTSCTPSMRPSALQPKFWQWPPVISGPAGFEVGAFGPLGQRCWVAIWQSVPDGRILPGTFLGENIYDFVGSADGRHPESALIYNLFVQLVICS